MAFQLLNIWKEGRRGKRIDPKNSMLELILCGIHQAQCI